MSLCRLRLGAYQNCSEIEIEIESENESESEGLANEQFF